MPELVEVEQYRLLAQRVVGRRVAAVEVVDPYVTRGAVTAGQLSAALVGQRIVAVRRKGKLLLVDLVDGAVLGLRFGMTGTLVVDGRRGVDRLLYSPAGSAGRWVRFVLRCTPRGELLLHDPRRLGRVELDPPQDALGPDALSVTPAQLAAALSSHRGSGPPLKARLQDQGRLAGIGNLLADEVLWRAGLSPERPSGSLSPAELRRLHRQLRTTLADLLARGGSHTGDLMPARRPGGRCPRDGRELRRARIGGRTTWWCPAHQR